MSQLSVRPAPTLPGIDPGLSGYFDLMRVLAAVTVVLSHLTPNLLGIDVFPGHDAVVVFFVISGYVIAYAAEQRDRTLPRFFVNRLARLWSVLLPSLILSGVAAVLVGTRTDVLFAPPLSDPQLFAAAAVRSALFVGQNWFDAVPAPYNDPAWSLNYEAWYYVIFAAFTFAPKAWRWHAAVIGAVLAGPAIIAMMPCWLVGTFLYRRRGDPVLRPSPSVALFAACVLLYALFYATDLGGHSRTWLSEMTGNHSYRLRASTRFGSDFIDACLFGGTVVALRGIPALTGAMARLRPLAATAAAKTFSLYMFHMPVFVLVSALFGLHRVSIWSAVACVTLVISVCVMLASVTEAQLGWWRRAVQWGVDAARSIGPPLFRTTPSGR